MAEAHQAVAFSFAITHEGWDVNFDREVLFLIWQSGVRSWKKRVARFMVRFCLFYIRTVEINYTFYNNNCPKFRADEYKISSHTENFYTVIFKNNFHY